MEKPLTLHFAPNPYVHIIQTFPGVFWTVYDASSYYPTLFKNSVFNVCVSLKDCNTYLIYVAM
jgi:hypothetical protein